MLINDKSQFKRNDEQIGFQLALKTSKSLVSADLTDSGRLLHTVGPATEKTRSPNLVLVRGTMMTIMINPPDGFVINNLIKLSIYYLHNLDKSVTRKRHKCYKLNSGKPLAVEE